MSFGFYIIVVKVVVVDVDFLFG